METNNNSNKDGLEEFFHNRLSGYQDEPSLDAWERIQLSMPEKPKHKLAFLKPTLTVAASGVAACLIFTLGFLNMQYKSQIQEMAGELDNSGKKYAALEERFNQFQQEQTQYMAMNQPVSYDDNTPKNHLNTSPSVVKEKEILTQVVYMPSPSSTAKGANNATLEEEKRGKKVNRPAEKKTTTTNKKANYFQRKPSKVLVHQFDTKDVLNLNKVTKRPYVGMFADARTKSNWNFVSDGLSPRSMVTVPTSNQIHRFTPHHANKKMALVTPSRMLASDRQIPIANAITSANYSIGSNFSLFMGADYLDAIPPSTETAFSKSAGMVGSGVKYHF